MTSDELEILAPAKVNLFLAVLGRRADGFHDIVSVMQKLDLADRIHLRRVGSGISLTCPSSSLPADSKNLAWQAARLFFDHIGIMGGVQIALHKGIPVAAGLGGGSSDAAAVLLGLNRLFDAGLGHSVLLSMAARLGADVPFFVADMNTALATGIGIELRPMTAPRGYWLVLVNPGLAVSTRWAYENLILTTDDNPFKLRGYSQLPEYAASLLEEVFERRSSSPRLFNDLEVVTIAHYPVLCGIKQQLSEDGAFAALMSGSGPTVFGVFSRHDLAEISYNKFRQHYPDTFLVTPLH